MPEKRHDGKGVKPSFAQPRSERCSKVVPNQASDPYERIGSIQGNSYYSNLGDTEGALRSYKTSVALLERGSVCKNQEHDELN